MNKFPPIDRPEIFGMHYNANYANIEQEGATTLAKIFDFSMGSDYQAESALGGQDTTDKEK